MRYLPQVLEVVGAMAVLWAVAVLVAIPAAVLMGGLALLAIAQRLERT